MTFSDLKVLLSGLGNRTVTSISMPVPLYLACRLYLAKEDVQTRSLSRFIEDLLEDRLSRSDCEFDKADINRVLFSHPRKQLPADYVRDKLGITKRPKTSSSLKLSNLSLLEEAKVLLDKGLISDEDYSKTKQEVLNKISCLCVT